VPMEPPVETSRAQPRGRKASSCVSLSAAGKGREVDGPNTASGGYWARVRQGQRTDSLEGGRKKMQAVSAEVARAKAAAAAGARVDAQSSAGGEASWSAGA
jgi:hypothetical protein